MLLPLEITLLCRSTLSSNPARFPSRLRRFASSSSQSTAPNKRWPGWIPVIGLELHVQLKGNVKLLSSAAATYEASPNTHVAPYDAALPGSLPVLGTEPVRLALLACLALQSDINQASTFDRKHYFYPDLPAGFQVTQKYSPLASGGTVKVQRGLEGVTEPFEVRIEQIQLEQDTAKSFHDPESGNTLVDLNRAGAALIEIVTRPDMKTPEEAASFVRQLQSILRHVGASDANMERGELRCDVNVSVRRDEVDSPMGARCEVKNLNGVRYLMGAIESEVQRQINILEVGGVVDQATRGYDVTTSKTFHLRSKEDAPDYRYMPDPELGPVFISSATLRRMAEELPELPDQAFDRLQSQYGLGSRDAGILVALGEGMEEVNGGKDSSAAAGVAFFEAVANGRDGKTTANWVIHELLGQLGKAQFTLATSPVSARNLGNVIDAVTSRKITGTNAKQLLATFISSPGAQSLSALIEQEATASTVSASLQEMCEDVIRDLNTEADKVRAGQTKVLMRLVGEVMKRSKGKADAKAVTEMLKSRL